jgi:hypothetical protein
MTELTYDVDEPKFYDHCLQCGCEKPFNSKYLCSLHDQMNRDLEDIRRIWATSMPVVGLNRAGLGT